MMNTPSDFQTPAAPGMVNADQRPVDVVVLFSGGLDSILAAKVLEEQGLRVCCLHCHSPFFGDPGAVERWSNLYGLDIDDRAAQLAYFAVMMKARQVDRRFFSRGIQPHVRTIAESGDMPKDAFALFGPQQDIARRVYAAFVDAKEYGSLIEPNVTLEELDALDARMVEMDEMADYGNLTV